MTKMKPGHLFAQVEGAELECGQGVLPHTGLTSTPKAAQQTSMRRIPCQRQRYIKRNPCSNNAQMCPRKVTTLQKRMHPLRLDLKSTQQNRRRMRVDIWTAMKGDQSRRSNAIYRLRMEMRIKRAFLASAKHTLATHFD